VEEMMEDNILNTEGSSEVEPTTTEATQEASVSNSFRDSLPEELRSDSSLQDFKDVGSLAKSYVNAQQMIGSSVRIPSQDASQEQRDEFYAKLSQIDGVARIPEEGNQEAIDAFYNKMGRPESADKYNLGLEEGQANEERVAEFSELAHQIGLTNSQAKALAQHEAQKAAMSAEQFQDSRTSAESSLKEAWGSDYNNRLAGAKAAAGAYAEKYPDAMGELVNGPAGNNPALLVMLSELGKTMQEAGTLGQASNLQYGVAPDEALANIQEVMDNKAHAYHNVADPGHTAAVEKMQKLYKSAYPE
jgi:hypothetical protein